MTLSEFVINAAHGTYGYTLTDTDGTIVHTAKPIFQQKSWMGVISDYRIVGWELFDADGTYGGTFSDESDLVLFLIETSMIDFTIDLDKLAGSVALSN